MANNNMSRKRRKKPNRFLKVLPYIGIVLVAAALIVAVIAVTSRKSNKDKEQLPSLVNIDESTKGEAEQAHILEKNANPTISNLVQKYFDAVKSANVKELKEIVVQDGDFNEASLKNDGEYIESYNNIVCYTVPGLVENTYIAYVYYEIKFIGIETKAPAMIRLYICQNDDGSMYIDKTVKDGEVQSYMQEVSTWEDVRKLVTDVNTKMQEAKSEDEQLQAFVDMLEGKEQNSGEDKESSAEEQTEEQTEAASDSADM